MTLKNDILSLLEKNGKKQYKNIRDETNKEKKKDWDVQVSNCLKELRDEELVMRECVERDSFYKITGKGNAELQRQRALGEISESSSPAKFWNLPCKLVESPNADASVYRAPIDLVTQEQIAQIVEKYPNIIIHGHPRKKTMILGLQAKEPSKSE